MHPITPCLWFDGQALEAARFYVSVFKGSKLGRIAYYGPGMPQPEGDVLTVEFRLGGQPFLALNGGPEFKFNMAISLTAYCDTQKEVDRLWSRLSSGGGEKSVCGWLKDRFGVSWQVVPAEIPKMIADKDPARAARVLQAVMKMKKLDIAKLRKAYGRN